MEGSEVPKVPESTGQSPENKELQLKAAELAKETREQGMGILEGIFPPAYLNKLGQEAMLKVVFVSAFIKGEDLPAGPVELIKRKDPDSFLTRSFLRRGQRQRNRQVWLVSQYQPPITRPIDTPFSYHGKHGEKATELEIIDERQKPRKQAVRKYPQPIPY